MSVWCCLLFVYINHGDGKIYILRSHRRQCTQIHQHLAVKSVWAGLVLTMVTRVESPVTQGFCSSNLLGFFACRHIIIAAEGS